MEQLFSTLFDARTQTHLFHLQTKSYAEHMALGGFYDSLLDMTDALIESYQGKYGIVTSYTPTKSYESYSSANVIKYLKGLGIYVERSYKKVKPVDTYILNQLDTITQLIYSTIYKLENLK